MRKTLAGLVAAIALTGCSTDNGDQIAELEADLQVAENALLQESDLAAEASAKYAEIDADFNALLDDIAFMETALQETVDGLENQIADLESKLAETEAALVEAQDEAVGLSQAFDPQIVAARELFASRLAGLPCNAGAADADAGGNSSIAELTVWMIAKAAADPNELAQFELIADSVIEPIGQQVINEYDECYGARVAALDAERLAAEQAALADLLPVVCDFYLHRGYIEGDRPGWHGRELSDYVADVFDGWPMGWQNSEAVRAESERCEALPRHVLLEGTWLVGVDIEPGTYASDQPVASSCYWERTNANGQILDNQFTQSAAQIVIQVRSSDYSVEVDGWCGRPFLGEPRPSTGGND